MKIISQGQRNRILEGIEFVAASVEKSLAVLKAVKRSTVVLEERTQSTALHNKRSGKHQTRSIIRNHKVTRIRTITLSFATLPSSLSTQRSV